MHLTRLRGFQDLFGASARAVSTVEKCARSIAERHAINEIRVPVLERPNLYERSSGETSDIVEKQLYIVERASVSQGIGGQVLRPEGTPGVIRAYIEASLDRSEPEQRYYYYGPMYRYERPQKGRYREFYQFGVEIFGRSDAAADAELLIMIDELRQELKLELEFQINSLGDAECRPAYRQALLEYGRAHIAELCVDCRQRLERNPLRLLDCKIDVELAAAAPKSLEYLCPPCRAHFGLVERLLTESGITYVVNKRLVRGLDYYMRTTFEVVSSAVGSQSAVVAGGRYDGLVEALGGASVAGTGFAIGVERLALAVEAASGGDGSATQVALIALGDDAAAAAIKLARELWQSNVRVELLAPDRGLKALMRRANKLGVPLAIIVGENEIARGLVTLRDLRASTQREIPLDTVTREVVAAVNPSRV